LHVCRAWVQLDAVAKAVELQWYPKGSAIITQGDQEANYFFILAQGTCEACIDGKGVVKTYEPKVSMHA